MVDKKYSIIGRRIYELRTEKGYSQSELGALLSVSQDTVSLWEKSKSLPPAEALIAMTKLFDTTADYILGITEY